MTPGDTIWGRVVDVGSGTEQELPRADSSEVLAHDLLQHVATLQMLVDSVQGRPADAELLEAMRAELQAAGRLCRSVLSRDASDAAAATRLDLVARESSRWVCARFDCDLRLDLQPCQVAVDDVTVQRIVTNLVENAAQAAGPGGVVRVGVWCEDGSGFLEVADSGPGPDAVQFSGEGLGLKIVTGLVEANRGNLTIDLSDVGGARLLVELPRSSAPQKDDGH